MPFKVVTGDPGAGKSYYVMREVICKRFTWDTEFHEWKRKTDDPFTIITNMAGLKLPHVNFGQHCKENGIDFRTFFTTRYIRDLTDKIGPVVVIYDEAQTIFPKTFRDLKEVETTQDFERSCFYFFEYHRHLPCEIYLLGQRWLRMHPDIVGLCDYQIHAVKRIFRLGNEFRYNFMNGLERVGGTILKTDKKIFALYQSFEGAEEVKGKQVHPVRRYAFLCVLGIVALLLAFKFFFASFFPEKVDMPAGSKEAGAGTVNRSSLPAPKPVQPAVKPPATASKPKLDVVLSDDPQVTRIRLGGMWLEGKLIAIDLFGNILAARDFPFAYTHNAQEGSVYAMLPDSYLAKIKRDVDTAHQYRLEQQQRAVQVIRSPLKDSDIESYIAKRSQRETLAQYQEKQNQ